MLVAPQSAPVEWVVAELTVPVLPFALDGRKGFRRISEFRRDIRDEPLRRR